MTLVTGIVDLSAGEEHRSSVPVGIVIAPVPLTIPATRQMPEAMPERNTIPS